MTTFWIGFFSFVAVLLFLDLFVFHKGSETQSFKSATKWTIGWVGLGLGFGAFVYAMYDGAWLGAKMQTLEGTSPGLDAAVVYWSAYLLELALSVDNIFVISLVFRNFRVSPKYQHRILFWGIMGAVVFRVLMLGGGTYLASKFDWIFYIFGAYLAWSGLKLFRGEDEEADESPLEKSATVRILRRFVGVADGDFGGKFIVRIDGKITLTTLAVCLIVVELTDVVFALDSIPAVLSVSRETFIVITSNIMAILGLRSLYFVLNGAMEQFHYLKYALAVLLIIIGAKMIAHNHFHIPNLLSLGIIAGILAIGVAASMWASRHEKPKPPGS